MIKVTIEVEVEDTADVPHILHVIAGQIYNGYIAGHDASPISRYEYSVEEPAELPPDQR